MKRALPLLLALWAPLVLQVATHAGAGPWSSPSEPTARTFALAACRDHSAFASSGLYGAWYADCGEAMPCGGDRLEAGELIIDGWGHVHVAIAVIDAALQPQIHTLYEVYWLAAGEDPTDPDRMHSVGSFITDENGEAYTELRDIEAAADAISNPPIRFFKRVPPRPLGLFLVFNRGPVFDPSAEDALYRDGSIRRYNAEEGSFTKPLRNPPVDIACEEVAGAERDPVQFAAPYRR